MSDDQHIDFGSSPASILERLKTLPVWRVAVLGAIALLAVVIVAALLSALLSTLRGGATTQEVGYQSATPGYGGGGGYGGSVESLAPATSARTSAPSPYPPEDDYSAGANAEAFEVRSYDVYVETRAFTRTCEAVAALKPRPEVIFERAAQGESRCSFRFKVELDAADGVLAELAALDPKRLSQSTDSIKQEVDDFLSRIDILTQNLAAVEAVLQEAQEDYDELSALATSEGDTETLATSIERKLALLDELRQRRERVRAELDRLNRTKAEQLDRLSYALFRVEVAEFQLVDREALADSWKRELQQFARTFNDFLQSFTLGFLTSVLWLLLIGLYLLLGVGVVKLGWRIVKRIWHL
ncbi:hypothetical protein GVX82_05230 [Patescibacteria group bacterium]|jgi:dsDNA-binding SOS-regulon protein|nr:hypothetical protein [Patescibacteria group bacterium]